MPTHYILIDFESVQPKTLPDLEQDNYHILVFVGANQAKLPFDFVAALQPFGRRAQYIRLSGNGPNALDFHIAFYIGQLSAQNPDACFSIFSKDTGFNPLIEHLAARQIPTSRITDMAMLLRPTQAAVADSANRDDHEGQSAGDRVGEAVDTTYDAIVLAKLKQLKAAKPRQVKTLSSTIATLFQKQLSEETIAAIIERLVGKGYLTITGVKVAYSLPEAE